MYGLLPFVYEREKSAEKCIHTGKKKTERIFKMVKVIIFWGRGVENTVDGGWDRNLSIIFYIILIF